MKLKTVVMAQEKQTCETSFGSRLRFVSVW